MWRKPLTLDGRPLSHADTGNRTRAAVVASKGFTLSLSTVSLVSIGLICHEKMLVLKTTLSLPEA